MASKPEENASTRVAPLKQPRLGIPKFDLRGKKAALRSEQLSDRSRLRDMGLKLLERDLLAEDGVIRHDPDRLARAVLEIAGV